MPESGSRAFCCCESVNAAITHIFLSQMLHLRAFFCRECRDYVLFGVEFWQKFWQKFLEILRILAEILRKKLACGASDGKSTATCSQTTMLT